jgi:NitT/TauT family transport system substrate-binding protein
MNKPFALLIGLIATVTAERALAETLKVAVAQRGFWNSTFIDVGLKQGYFKDVGLDIDILYTEGGASTLTPVIAGSIDIAMTNGILGVVAAYAKGMPVKIISAEATGAADAFWYARPDSGIRALPTPTARRSRSPRPAPRPTLFCCSW